MLNPFFARQRSLCIVILALPADSACVFATVLHTVARLACQTHKSEVYHAEDR